MNYALLVQEKVEDATVIGFDHGHWYGSPRSDCSSLENPNELLTALRDVSPPELLTQVDMDLTAATLARHKRASDAEIEAIRTTDETTDGSPSQLTLEEDFGTLCVEGPVAPKKASPVAPARKLRAESTASESTATGPDDYASPVSA